MNNQCLDKYDDTFSDGSCGDVAGDDHIILRVASRACLRDFLAQVHMLSASANMVHPVSRASHRNPQEPCDPAAWLRTPELVREAHIREGMMTSQEPSARSSAEGFEVRSLSFEVRSLGFKVLALEALGLSGFRVACLSCCQVSSHRFSSLYT